MTGVLCGGQWFNISMDDLLSDATTVGSERRGAMGTNDGPGRPGEGNIWQVVWSGLGG